MEYSVERADDFEVEIQPCRDVKRGVDLELVSIFRQPADHELTAFEALSSVQLRFLRDRFDRDYEFRYQRPIGANDNGFYRMRGGGMSLLQVQAEYRTTEEGHFR